MANQTVKTRGLYLRGRIWQYNVTENGRAVRRSTHQTSKAAAMLELLKVQTRRNEGHSILERKKVDSIQTFGALCDHWYAVHLSQKRMNGATNMISIWKNGIGANTLLKSITGLTIQQFFDAHVIHCKSTGRGFGDSSRNRHLTMMQAMYARGLKDGWISGKSPVANIDRKPEAIGRTRFLTTDEVTRLLSDEQTPLWLREFMIMALHTGMRAGEMKALKWNSVNLVERILTVTHSKSGKGRQLDIDDTLLAVLKRRHGVRNRGSLVFPSPKPGHQEVPLKNYDDSWRLAMSRAGIEGCRWHDLRHTFASHLVMAGVDLSTVQACLGHSQQTMTQRYVNLAPNHVKKAVRMLDKVFAPTPVRDTLPEGQHAQNLAHTPEMDS